MSHRPRPTFTSRRRILLVAPTFAPQNVVGVYRMHRLLKLLPRLGWEPHVLTVDRNYVRPEDPTLLEELGDSVHVHTAKYVEPTKRGVKAALHIPNVRQTGVSLEDELRHSDPANTPGKDWRASARHIFSDLREMTFNNPDLYATWYWPATRAARRLVQEHDFSLVITSSPEYTGHRVAADLASRGLPWVADFRDPGAYIFYSRFDRVFLRQRQIERIALARANAVTVASEGTGMVLREMYRLGPDAGLQVIPSGIDSYDPDIEPLLDSGDYLLFSGSMSAEYGSEFLEIFALALRDAEVRRTGIRLLVVGELEHNVRHVIPRARELGIESFIQMQGRVSQREVLRLLAGARAGVLPTGRSARWWCLHAKQVEYMGMRKRVVALLPELSESRLHLERTGLGVFLDGTREEASLRLANFILGRLDLPPINEQACDCFTATRMAESFVSVFNEVLSGSS